MRRAATIALAALGLALLALDLCPVPGADGLVRMHWSWFGAQAWLPAPLPLAEFAGRVRSALPWLFVLTLSVSALLGTWTARVVARRLRREAGPLAIVLCSLAWAAALDPEIALFVATRQPFAAERYVDIGDLLRALGLGMLVLAVFSACPARAGTDPEPERPASPRASIAAAMLVAVLLPELLSWIFLGHHPLSNDEFAYLFQARLMARGELARDMGALAEFFPSVETKIVAGRIFGMVLPGHPALLVPGVWLGLPLLLPRLFAAASVWLTSALGRRLGCARPAWGAWALALSPAFLGVEALDLAHGTSLPCLLFFVWCSLDALERSSRWSAALSGLAFSIGFAARPVTAIAILVPVLVLALRRRPQGGFALLGLALLAALPAAAGFLEFNRELTGSPWQTPYGKYLTSNVSFYGDVSPALASSISAFNLARLSSWMSGVAPGLLLPALALAFAPRNARTWLLAALAASLFAFYTLHPFQGIPWVGPLYLSDSLPYLALLASEGLVRVEGAFGRAAVRASAVAALVGSALLLLGHFRMAEDEIELRQRPYALARQAGIERGIVFVRLELQVAYARFPLAPPEPGSAILFARDLGARNPELVRALGNPPAWICDPLAGELTPVE